MSFHIDFDEQFRRDMGLIQLQQHYANGIMPPNYFAGYLNERLKEPEVRKGYEEAEVDAALADHGRRHLKKVLLSVAVVSGIVLLIRLFSRKD